MERNFNPETTVKVKGRLNLFSDFDPIKIYLKKRQNYTDNCNNIYWKIGTKLKFNSPSQNNPEKKTLPDCLLSDLSTIKLKDFSSQSL